METPEPSGIRRAAVVGATGMLGQPVTRALDAAGFDVTAISRDPDKAKARFPGLHVEYGDVLAPKTLRTALAGQDAIYLNLNRADGEKPDDPHAEKEGLRNVIAAAKAAGTQRLLLISALVLRYQGTKGFDWWVFRMKEEAVKMVKESGIPYTIFYPSSFMETLLRDYRQGDRMLLIGKSHGPQYWIAGDDYGQQVARALRLDSSENREYVVQGPQAFTTEEAIRVFLENWQGAPLKHTRIPIAPLRLAGLFNQKVSDGWHILTALNEYHESFEARPTWDELGTPTTTIAGFAKQHSG